jgi:hypothetical protein
MSALVLVQHPIGKGPFSDSDAWKRFRADLDSGLAEVWGQMGVDRAARVLQEVVTLDY